MKTEKIKYTKEEKELTELCSYLKVFYERSLIVALPDDEFFKNKIKEADFYLDKIKEVTEHRRNYFQTKTEKEQKKWDTIRNVDCPKCKKYTEQKPKGKMRNDKNWRVFLFYCPHCKKKSWRLVSDRRSRLVKMGG